MSKPSASGGYRSIPGTPPFLSRRKALIEKRGHLGDDDLVAFVETGYQKDQVLEVVAVSAASTITNYAGNVTKPPLESYFQEHVWQG
jgi:hypothetical protein